jgi:predicted dehydrogenase
MKTIQHAIVGCGRVAPNHIDGFSSVDGVQLRWACDRDPAALARFTGEFGVERATTDLAEVLADPEVHSVSVTVDHAQHASIAALALEHGKHVLLEKPIALDVAEAHRLVELARARDLVLAVVSQHRYDTLVQDVRQWVADGLLGRLLMCSISLRSNRPAEYYSESYWRGTWQGEGGSALINQGYHCLDIAHWLCGPFTVRAAAIGRTVLADVIETEETLCALLAGGDGLLATFGITVSSAETWRTGLELTGESGTVLFDLDHPNRLHRCTGNEALTRVGAQARTRVEADSPPGIDYYGTSHRRQIADFCNSIRTGEPMLSPVTDAIGTLGLIQQLYEVSGARPAGPAGSTEPTRPAGPASPQGAALSGVNGR